VQNHGGFVANYDPVQHVIIMLIDQVKQKTVAINDKVIEKGIILENKSQLFISLATHKFRSTPPSKHPHIIIPRVLVALS
jgi:hypothetical protein